LAVAPDGEGFTKLHAAGNVVCAKLLSVTKIAKTVIIFFIYFFIRTAILLK
jgi:hypothetical protein